MFTLAFLTSCHSRSIHSFHDDVVAIVADCGHRTNTAQPEDGASARVKFTPEGPEQPYATGKAIPDEHWELGDHHAEIGKCKIDDEYVSWGLQLFRLSEKV